MYGSCITLIELMLFLYSIHEQYNQLNSAVDALRVLLCYTIGSANRCKHTQLCMYYNTHFIMGDRVLSSLCIAGLHDAGNEDIISSRRSNRSNAE